MSNNQSVENINNSTIAGGNVNGDHNSVTCNKGAIADKKEEKQSKCSFWMSAIALASSFLLAVAFFVDTRVVVSDQSLIISFIGILVTFIVIGNYAQVQDVKREFEKQTQIAKKEYDEKLQNIEKGFNERMEDKIDDYDYSISALVLLTNAVIRYFEKGAYEYAIDGFMVALDSANRGSRKNPIVGNILSFLLGIKQKYENGDDIYKRGIYIIKGRLDYYLGILSNTKDINTIIVRDFLLELDEKTPPANNIQMEVSDTRRR